MCGSEEGLNLLYFTWSIAEQYCGVGYILFRVKIITLTYYQGKGMPLSHTETKVYYGNILFKRQKKKGNVLEKPRLLLFTSTVFGITSYHISVAG